MSNPYARLLSLIPKKAEFIGTVTYADHPNYKVQLMDSSGLLLCTSTTEFKVNARVFVAGTEIKRSAPIGTVTKIEV